MNEHPVSTLDLMEFLAGDLDDMNRYRVESHLATCERCRERLTAFRKERDTFLADHSFEKQDFPEQASKTARPNSIPFPGQRSLVAIAASLLLAIGASTFFIATQKGQDAYRTKGSAGLAMFVQNDSGKPEQRTQPIYHPGERIQFTYTSPKRAWFMLIGADTAGTITVYFPAAGDTAMVLAPGADLPLPNSIILDDYLGPELFMGLFFSAPQNIGSTINEFKTAYQNTHSLDHIEIAAGNARVHGIRIEKKARIAP